MNDVELEECGCGWLFVKSREIATRCNECGGNTTHPRVCRPGDKATDWAVLEGLARYVLSFSLGSITLLDIIDEKIAEESGDGE